MNMYTILKGKNDEGFRNKTLKVDQVDPQACRLVPKIWCLSAGGVQRFRSFSGSDSDSA